MGNQLMAFLQSSQDPSQVGNKVKGIILACSSIIMFVALQFFHVQLSVGDIGTFGTEIGTLAGLVWSIYGVFLHLVTWIGTVKANNSNNN